MAADQDSKPMTLRQYRALADFRYELRRFLRYSEQLTRRHGVTPLQYQLLLQVKGYPDRDHATIYTPDGHPLGTVHLTPDTTYTPLTKITQ